MTGWGNGLMRNRKSYSKKLGYKPPQITAKQLVNLRNNTTRCSDGCGQKLRWCTNGDFMNPHLHHDHKTGKIYGFTTAHCNSAQGHFEKIGRGSTFSQMKWLRFHFPAVVDFIKQETE